MNPRDRFAVPKPAPQAQGDSEIRVGSLPSTPFSDERRVRSPSPGPRWAGAARRLFGLKHSGREDERGRSSRGSNSGYTSPDLSRARDGTRSATPSGSIRSREMSPESLRRFLSDDIPFAQPTLEPSPKLWIPEEIVEENEDDDNFATSAVSETAPVTMLSPPPAQRTKLPSLPRSKNESTATIVAKGLPRNTGTTSAPVESYDVPPVVDVKIPRSHFSFSTKSSRPASPTSHSVKSRDRGQHSFLDSEDDDDDCISNEDGFSSQQAETKENELSQRRAPFTNYSLPCHNLESKKTAGIKSRPTFGSPELIARNENGVPVGNTNLLSLPPIDSGLEDLANEISWIADVVRPKEY